MGRHPDDRVALALVMLSPTGAGAVALLVLDDSAQSIPVWSMLTMLPDPSIYNAHELLNDPTAFGPLPETAGTLGVRPEAVWLRVPLALAPPPTDSGPCRSTTRHSTALMCFWPATGASCNRRHWAISSHLIFGLAQPGSSHGAALEPGARHDLLLRVQAQGAMILPITLAKPAALLGRALQEQMLQVCYRSGAVSAGVQPGPMGQPARCTVHPVCLADLGQPAVFIAIFGMRAQYLWNHNPWLERHASGLSALMASLVARSCSLVRLWRGNPRHRLMRAMRVGAMGTAALAVAFALDVYDTQVLTSIVSILGLVPALMGIPGAVARMRQGDAVGATLLLAWLVCFCGHCHRDWRDPGLGAGEFLDPALVPVRRDTRHAVVHARARPAFRPQRTAAEHTRIERDTLHSLAHTDPLTGLPNRRGLNLSLTAALTHCSPERLVAIYVMDLDGFKPVNDQHGHDVGDELWWPWPGDCRGQVRQTIWWRGWGRQFVVMASQIARCKSRRTIWGKTAGVIPCAVFTGCPGSGGIDHRLRTGAAGQP